MKIFFAAVICFAVVLAACDLSGDDESRTTLQINNQSGTGLNGVTFQNVVFVRENADIIGTWTWAGIGGMAASHLTLNITDTAWTGTANYSNRTHTGSGQWSREGNALTLSNNDSHGLMNGFGTLVGNRLTVNFRLTGAASTAWRSDRSFETTSDNLQLGMAPGNTVLKDVPAGSAFIFFEVNSVEYFTRDLVVVEEDGSAMFTFTNSTIIVEAATGDQLTLGSL
ncbi:MAG: hypothetical protein FWB79_01330 [Treponema sp.]|nr:hypothetical protein [Treponema sp.]